MQQLYLLLTICFSCFFLSNRTSAQSGCPGCVVNVPASFPADTIYLPDLPDGSQGTAYDHDVSFRLPKTTTPVNAIDSTTPPGLTITKFEILSIDGLPQGLYWQLNKSEFDPANETDGCIRICGTPLESDSFELTVTLKATVFIITQESSFPMSLYIAPKVSSTDGFSMTNPSGCGSTTVSFENLVPSNGAEGYTYSWDFGDGSPLSDEENPGTHTYGQPGVYEVNYQAIVDTAGYTLESIRVIDIDCTEPPFFGNPDLFLEIRFPDGNIAFNSSPYIPDTDLPYIFPINMPLQSGNYTLTVWDEDGGIKGSDDQCGTLTFNLLSDGTLVAGGLTVEMNILHPVDTVISRDTVTVFSFPSAPVVDAPDGLEVCAGSGEIILVSSYLEGNQWIENGQSIAGANSATFLPAHSGSFQVQYTSPEGCSAVSAAAEVEIHALPAQPVWFNYNNSLRLMDTMALPAQYSLQWHNGAGPILGETGFRYCSKESGTYGLVVTDLTTGCTNEYFATVVHNPNFDCTVAAGNPALVPFELFPNPTSGVVSLQLREPLPSATDIRIFDAAGRKVYAFSAATGEQTIRLELGALDAGVYAVEILAQDFRAVGRVSKW